MRKIERISISAADRERLERLVRDRNTPQKVVWRARIVLLASDGRTAEAIAARRVSPEGQEGLRAFLEKRKAAWDVSRKS
jgi:enoyl-CoA hydratase/carnithine racemase